MPIFSFLLDCSYPRKPGSIFGFCLSHSVICLGCSMLAVYLSHSANAGRRMAIMYLNCITMLPVMQKRLHSGFYLGCLLSALGTAFGGILIGILPVAYLLRRPSNRKAAVAS